ncbi:MULTISPECIES: bifunctional helix-turn-helix transcriptional regulator/GNAT family N-acetyltransferase [Chryseobacterium]|uniref:bifunctional helix-turn-helix transcriptional regulator/GNAT family N-acetyltransferase n=1 Tax=Chryseobacterium TaxID=59732 RepID=UPI001BE8E87E|nr:MULTISPECIES: helix-turn-helix domain-containing GNAT family N-acetyltransferase [Chryseobacterium]MBT2619910.1 MarR family transcriptional regulator [Chryseobacterium sp. ISL-6]
MKQEYIDQIRSFNRNYTQVLGLLNKGILDGDLGISEVRVMREIYFNSDITPTQIASTLELDKGFLSRILKRFEKLGLTIKKKSGEDHRSNIINLTDVGRMTYEKINLDSDNQIENLFTDFSKEKLKTIIRCMNTIDSLLHQKDDHDPVDPIIIRPIEEKDNEQLAALIRQVFDEFNASKKGSVYDDPQTDILYQHFLHPSAEYWVVECNHTILGGCGFYPTPGLPSSCAEIVKFYLSDKLRGNGIGLYLLNMIEERAKKAGYHQLYLESFEVFQGAVSLYEKLGYKHLDDSLGNSGHYATTIHMLKSID